MESDNVSSGFFKTSENEKGPAETVKSKMDSDSDENSSKLSNSDLDDSGDDAVQTKAKKKPRLCESSKTAPKVQAPASKAKIATSAAKTPSSAASSSLSIPNKAVTNRTAPIKDAVSAKAIVKDYMFQTNRPYSIINIVDNLHKSVPKTVCQNSLDELVIDGDLKLKEFGKNKIYYVNQERYAASDGSSGASLTAESFQAAQVTLKETSDELSSAKVTLSTFESQLVKLKAQPTNSELDVALAKGREDVSSLKTRISRVKEQLKRSSSAQQPRQDLNVLRGNLAEKRDVWLLRKNKVMDIVSKLSEQMNCDEATVMNITGIESDEKAKERIPQACFECKRSAPLPKKQEAPVATPKPSVVIAKDKPAVKTTAAAKSSMSTPNSKNKSAATAVTTKKPQQRKNDNDDSDSSLSLSDDSDF